jgi:hypothetical protein
MKLRKVELRFPLTKLGSLASQGRIRTPATMDRFWGELDVPDAGYEGAAWEDVRLAAILFPERRAGDAMRAGCEGD